ncbi:MAG TPA: PEP-CTERM sorting domain-containing protein [Gemmatimonadaceae bacterium]|nr:PEP-CTERM sorting domain-containing protein [Gemmatimonadaceae bacterium]
MKSLAIVCLALATQLGAQVTSQQRIRVNKQQVARVDTVVIQLVDTVFLHDTLYVPAAAPFTTTFPFDSLAQRDTTCGRGVVPIPIPIPIPDGHEHPASIVPEPATLWMTGLGLLVIGFMWGRARRVRART